MPQSALEVLEAPRRRFMWITPDRAALRRPDRRAVDAHHGQRQRLCRAAGFDPRARRGRRLAQDRVGGVAALHAAPGDRRSAADPRAADRGRNGGPGGAAGAAERLRRGACAGFRRAGAPPAGRAARGGHELDLRLWTSTRCSSAARSRRGPSSRASSAWSTASSATLPLHWRRRTARARCICPSRASCTCSSRKWARRSAAFAAGSARAACCTTSTATPTWRMWRWTPATRTRRTSAIRSVRSTG